MFRRIVFQVFLFSDLVLAQRLPDPDPKIVINPDKPNEVIATVDGKPFTQRDLQMLLVTMTKAQQDAVRNDPVTALQTQGWLKKLAGLAEKEGLDKEDPFRQRIEMNRLTILSEALVQRYEQNDSLSPEMLKGYYERMKGQFSAAKLKMIYLSFTDAKGELEAKKKAEDLYAQLKAGADFVALVREHSQGQTTRDKDGDYGPVKRSDNIPESVKQTIFGLKPGEISQPLRLPNGYYLLKLIGLEEPTYEQVKDQLAVEVKQMRSREWMQKMRGDVEVKVVAPAK